MTTRSSKEAGLAEFQASPWWALFAPEGTPRPILDKVTDALDKALDDQNVRMRLLDIGVRASQNEVEKLPGYVGRRADAARRHVDFARIGFWRRQ
jgi:tripartite-type tricarboxylate transporter receptor subunit TctC